MKLVMRWTQQREQAALLRRPRLQFRQYSYAASSPSGPHWSLVAAAALGKPSGVYTADLLAPYASRASTGNRGGREERAGACCKVVREIRNSCRSSVYPVRSAR